MNHPHILLDMRMRVLSLICFCRFRSGHRKFKVASDKKTNQLFSEAYRFVSFVVASARCRILVELQLGCQAVQREHDLCA